MHRLPFLVTGEIGTILLLHKGGEALMEYLLVQFSGIRRVLVDGEPNGHTGEVIELEAGTYSVSLGPPADFTPSRRRIVLSGTNALEPREMSFDEA